MDEGLFQNVPEARLRRIFGRSCGPSNSGLTDATAATASSVSNDTSKLPATPSEAATADKIDPLFPSLDKELPQVRKSTTLFRPSWDPRERWRQLRPSQPYYAPPESDLPAQFRYEDLSIYEKSETMDIHEDRLLRWLHERFESSLEFKAAAGDTNFLNITGKQAIKQQVFTELQILDEQLSDLGLDSANPALIERRRQLVEQQRKPQQAPPVSPSSGQGTSQSSRLSSATVSTTTAVSASTATAAAAASASIKLSPLDELNMEFEEDEDFGAFVSPSLAGRGTQTTQTVVTVHEAAWQQQPLEQPARRPRKHRHLAVNFAAGDEATGSGGGSGGGSDTIECEVDIRPSSSDRPAAARGRGHRVQHFGDAASLESGDFASKKPSGHRNTAEESV
ncbi:hypothetical protein BOX15_Mlig010964g1 [Macrostomum lignano]|uniref:Uncharacterized protein n=1 Tax=Macrostomum lignano TaxID=282301 RepID=A0A267G5R0_9PLAT|nr:hypothetical protein BOX15_Mlig010964g2 [Macrostomum lignano]PAA86807.1 hypothetical protein BOX15_Mlig010964g1 [Macrostomum lignano]